VAGPCEADHRFGKQLMRPLFVLVPSLVPTGPIKGAVALCNALAAHFDVTLVALKRSPDYPGPIDPRVRQVRLAEAGGWWAYRRMLQQAGGRPRVLSLSFCFSADVVNFLVRRHAVTVSSIRGHLPRVYQVDFGRFGKLLAVLHYRLAGRLDRAVAMTQRMAEQFRVITGKRPLVIGNFVDEAQLEPLRARGAAEQGAWRFVFVGRLDPLKIPDQVIDAVCRLHAQGVLCSLDVFGDGPLQEQLKAQVARQQAGNIVRFHGHVASPWERAAGADCFVLPSLTEGVSRAALEALYLGVPCVMRDVDSNPDLVRPGENGALFTEEAALVSAMQQVARLGRGLQATRPVLLPESFRQAVCVAGYRELLEGL
jgi:glycosyltransferase involved in cell wall biosynthesis